MPQSQATLDSIDQRVSQMLTAARGGSSVAASALMPIVYNQLRGLAAQYLKNERRGHTLQPTALVHEAYLRIVGTEEVPLQDRTHFFALAARVMRQILVDHARKNEAGKRWPEKKRVELTDQIEFNPERAEDFLALDSAIAKLEKLDPRQSHIVELHFFGGLTFEEISSILNIVPRTIKRDWSVARAWLHRELTEGT